MSAKRANGGDLKDSKEDEGAEEAVAMAEAEATKDQASAEYQFQGLRRNLAKALFATARQAGAHRGYLQVEADNAPAVTLYEAFGFREAYRYRYWGR